MAKKFESTQKYKDKNSKCLSFCHPEITTDNILMYFLPVFYMQMYILYICFFYCKIGMILCI